MITALIVIAIITGALGLLFVVFVMVPKRMLAAMRGPLEARVRQRYGQEELAFADYAASSFGVQSAGVLQVRGNGALVMTGRELCFFQFTPSRELVIPLDSVTGVSLVRSHLGKATPYKLLRVSYSTASGPDAVAWFVRTPDSFKDLIEKAQSKVS